jgi:hypothetical protein
LPQQGPLVQPQVQQQVELPQQQDESVSVVMESLGVRGVHWKIAICQLARIRHDDIVTWDGLSGTVQAIEACTVLPQSMSLERVPTPRSTSSRVPGAVQTSRF